MIARTAYLMLAANLLVGCGRTALEYGDERIVENPFTGTLQNGPPAFELELVQTFGAESDPPEAILERVMSAHVDHAGRLFVADNRQIVAFDDQGRLMWAAAAEGEGPGEFRFPLSVIPDSAGRLVVANQIGTRIDYLDSGGAYVSSLFATSFGYTQLALTGFIDSNRLVGVQLIPGRVAAEIVVFDTSDDEWQVFHSFVVDQTGDLEISRPVNLPAHVTVADGRIHVGSINQYQMISLTASGDTLSIVRRDVPDFTRIGIGRDEQRGIRFFSGMEGAFSLPSGRFLIWARWPTNVPDPDTYITLQMNGAAPEIEWVQTLDLFEADGTLLYSISAEDLEIGVPIQSQNGYLYTRRSSPYPHVAKFRVIESI